MKKHRQQWRKKAQNQGTCWFREYAKIAKGTIHVAMCLKKNHGSLLVLNLLPQVFKECFTHIDEKFSMARLKNSTDASAEYARLQLYTCGANNHDNIKNHH